MTHEGVVYPTHAEATEVFASYFNSVFSPPVPDDDSVGRHLRPTVNLSHLEFSREDVYRGLLKLKTNRGSGPDGIPKLFLVRCATTLAHR